MIKRLSDTAIDIINELHKERLDYKTEYVPLIEAALKLAEYEDAEEQGLLVRLGNNISFEEQVMQRIVRRDKDDNGNIRGYDEAGNEIYYKDLTGFEVWKEYDDNGKLIHYKDSTRREEWY